MHIILVLKYVTQLKITSTMEKISRVRTLKRFFSKHFCKEKMWLFDKSFFNGAVIISHTNMIYPTDKPIILCYYLDVNKELHTQTRTHKHTQEVNITPIILLVIYSLALVIYYGQGN